MNTTKHKANTFIKDKKYITQEYIDILGIYILTNQETFFAKDNEAKSWCDFIGFEQISKTDRTHLCMPTEPFLVDRSVDGVHTYCICTISENRRVTSEIPVIEISKLESGKWRNGYFLLPKLLPELKDLTL